MRGGRGEGMGEGEGCQRVGVGECERWERARGDGAGERGALVELNEGKQRESVDRPYASTVSSSRMMESHARYLQEHMLDDAAQTK